MPGFKGGRTGKKFGPKRPWKGGADRGASRGFERKEMYDAVCTACGDDCQVPFRPNGTKPVKCRNCFKVDDTRSFGEKRSFGGDRRPSFARPQQTDNKQIEIRLGAIEAKLDALLAALSQQ